MEAYTIEDVELLRRKGGMTYQEAVALLEYQHCGDTGKRKCQKARRNQGKSDQPAAEAVSLPGKGT